MSRWCIYITPIGWVAGRSISYASIHYTTITIWQNYKVSLTHEAARHRFCCGKEMTIPKKALIFFSMPFASRYGGTILIHVVIRSTQYYDCNCLSPDGWPQNSHFGEVPPASHYIYRHYRTCFKKMLWSELCGRQSSRCCVRSKGSTVVSPTWNACDIRTL